MRPIAFALLTCLTSAAALGGFAAPAPVPGTAPPGLPPNQVSPVTVFPKTDAPKVVKSYPAAGQEVAPGIMVLSVTFDQPMQKSGFDYGSSDGEPSLDCLKTPRLLDDNKTFVLLCTSEPQKTYNLTFNAKTQGGFINVAEHRADPATLTFKTASGDGPKDIHEAMKAAGLRDIDMPIAEMPGMAPPPSQAKTSP